MFTPYFENTKGITFFQFFVAFDSPRNNTFEVTFAGDSLFNHLEASY